MARNHHNPQESIFGELSYEACIPAKEPVFVPVPAFVPLDVLSGLSENGIHFLFRHQSQALSYIADGKNVIISTGTASGKSLCYQIPIMEMLLTEESTTAILVFPTKALAQDQFRSLCRLLPQQKDRIAIYDGDTPSDKRTLIRQNARVVLTNPDMLHIGILPRHPSWADFFANLKLVVIDEVHVYRGVFGSHLGNVIRRIKRVSAHYGLLPQFILCSATLSNAAELAGKLLESDVALVSEDFSGNGKRVIRFINPPIIDEELSLRCGAIYTAAKAAQIEVKNNHQLLLFCQSRRSVESTVVRLREQGVDAEGYRSGYLPSERRSIEKGLKDRSKRCVVATNALELGMDIGGMDSIISIGYPGSVSATMQRMGRAGRNLKDSEFQLIASQTPTDQYLMRHPEFIMERPCEPALIDADNLTILFQHMQCALYEVPFSTNEAYGSLDIASTQEILNFFVQSGVARLSNGHYYWIQSNLPQVCVSLRNSSLERIAIITMDINGMKRIGEVDQASAYWMVHKGAIYFHNGVSYLIKGLDLKDNAAFAERFEAFYTTEAQKETHIVTHTVIDHSEMISCKVMTADVTVKSKVVSFQKKDNETYQILETVPLDLPEEVLETKSFILCLEESFCEQLRAMNIWQNDANDYGADWEKIRKQVLQRDKYICRLCHLVGADSQLHVHHIKPFRSFTDAAEANQVDNLICLCPDCHRRVEQAVKMRSGLAGFADAFHQIAALYLECDVSDLGVVVEPECVEFDGAPTIYLHEFVPGGIGFSQAVYKNYSLIVSAVVDLIKNCDCTDGCPGCVGAAGENGVGGKAAALAIGAGLLKNE